MYIIKFYPKTLVMTGHINNVESVNGIEEQRIAVKGKEHNINGIEHNFTIVLFADALMVDNKRQYIYKLHSDGITTAKTPPIFCTLGVEKIENDINAFLELINKVLNK